MKASVLICTYNSAGKLPPTLAHLRRQKFSFPADWEVIIVDYAASTDGTLEVARESWKGSNVPLRCFKEQRPGKTPALNTGLENALGEAICIVDDDNWVSESYVKIALRIMEAHPDVGVVGAYGEAVCEVPPPDWFADLKYMYAVGEQADRSGYANGSCLSFWGAGSVIRKSAWTQLKARGFEPVFNPCRTGVTFKKGFTGGEDPELCYAIQLMGYRLWYEPSLKYQHYIPAARLTRKYIEATALGVNLSSPILKIYQCRLKKGTWYNRLKTTMYSNWFLHFLGAVVMYGCNEVKLMFGKNTLKRSKSRQDYRGQILGLWHWKGRFRNIVCAIDRLKL